MENHRRIECVAVRWKRAANTCKRNEANVKNAVAFMGDQREMPILVPYVHHHLREIQKRTTPWFSLFTSQSQSRSRGYRRDSNNNNNNIKKESTDTQKWINGKVSDAFAEWRRRRRKENILFVIFMPQYILFTFFSHSYSGRSPFGRGLSNAPSSKNKWMIILFGVSFIWLTQSHSNRRESEIDVVERKKEKERKRERGREEDSEWGRWIETAKKKNSVTECFIRRVWGALALCG